MGTLCSYCIGAGGCSLTCNESFRTIIATLETEYGKETAKLYIDCMIQQFYTIRNGAIPSSNISQPTIQKFLKEKKEYEEYNQQEDAKQYLKTATDKHIIAANSIAININADMGVKLILENSASVLDEIVLYLLLDDSSKYFIDKFDDMDKLNNVMMDITSFIKSPSSCLFVLPKNSTASNVTASIIPDQEGESEPSNTPETPSPSIIPDQEGESEPSVIPDQEGEPSNTPETPVTDTVESEEPNTTDDEIIND